MVKKAEAQYIDDSGPVDSNSVNDDSDYVACSDDSGLDEEYVELREQAKAFKKKIRDSKQVGSK